MTDAVDHTAEVKALVARVVAENPDLTTHGFRYTNRRGELVYADMPAPSPGVAEMLWCAEFLMQFCTPHDRALSTDPGSYRIKHRVEAFAARCGEPTYIASGTLILVALMLYYPVRRYEHGGPNCLIGAYVKRRTVNSL